MKFTKTKLNVTKLYTLAGVALFMLAYLAYICGGSMETDRYISLVAQSLHGSFADIPMKIVSALGTPPAFLLYSLAIAIYLYKKGRTKAILIYFSAMFSTALSSSVIKELVMRARPQERLEAISSFSFPSWHASMSMAFAFSLTMLFLYPVTRRKRWVYAALFLFPLIIGASRIYLNVHWFSDVLGGWGLGAAVAGGVWWLYGVLESPRGQI